MVTTRYQTYILRVRLAENPLKELAEAAMAGSVQQVGQPELLFFDSAEKLQEAIRQLIVQSFPGEGKADSK